MTSEDKRACANRQSGQAQTLVGLTPVVGSTPTARTIKKVYGPYAYADGSARRMVLRYFTDGTKQTVQHAKHVWEEANGPVPRGMEVHHINDDCGDDRLENLELVDRRAHRLMHAATTEVYYGVCPECGKPFAKKARNVRGNIKKGKAGPFCGKSCAGKYGTDVQYGKRAA